MEPDEILDALDEGGVAAEVNARRLIDAVRRAHAEGQLDFSTSPSALPIFLLGIVGGAVGVRVLKGTLGLAIAAGAGYWAWNQLQKPAPKQVPSEVQRSMEIAPTLQQPGPMAINPPHAS